MKHHFIPKGETVQDKLEVALKNLRLVEASIAGMYEEAQGDEHVHMAESRLRDAMFLLRHAIDQLEEWRKGAV